MERILPNKVELVLLHEELESMDADVLLKLTNEFAAGFNMSFEKSRLTKSGDYLHYAGQNATFEIDYVQEPVAFEAFASALQSGQVIENFPEATDIARQHNCYVHICIWNGKYEPVDPITGEQPPLPQAFDGPGFDVATSLLRMISAIHINFSKPTAVYWAQSDRFLRMAEYLKLAIDFKDLSLLVHPQFETQEDLDSGSRLHGLITVGACNLVGKELAIDPVQMPESELYDCALHFLSITRGTGLLIPDGDVFGRYEGESIRVRYHESSETDASSVRMTIEHSEKFGIGEPPLETSDEEESEDFNLEDPAEKAMHDRIEEMKQASESASASEEEVSEFKGELGHETEWRGVQRKVDMSSLRSLTQTSDRQVATPQEKSHSSIMGKVGGLFQRGAKDKTA